MGPEMEVSDRPLESFTVGETASFTMEITADAIEAFAGLSGDHNPLHQDPRYASSTVFGRPIAHGQLVAASISRLAGHFLPGRRCMLLEVRSRFLHPVFAGDRLTYRGTVRHISAATRVLKVDVEVTNQEGVVVLRGAYEGQVLAGSSDEERR
jgi:3-hydroxybutyryl-CoA dehydratase